MPSSSDSPDSAPSPSDNAPSAGSSAGAVDAPILAAAASFYELLQVPPAATPEQLRQSFRRLSKRYHPDTTTLPVLVAERAFLRLKRAYSVLSDPRARHLYDERRSRLPSPATARAAAPTTPVGSGQGAPVSLRRALSGGEWFALLLLALALLLSLVLGIGVAWARGAELVRWPSWWTDLHPAALASAGVSPEDGKVGTPQSPLLTADASDIPAS